MENTTENNNNATTNNNNLPIQIPPPNTLNAIRSTYMNLFNQILDSSFNINCICKTTIKLNANSKQKQNHQSKLNVMNKCNIFDKVHGDFMSDEDDNEEIVEEEENVNGENDLDHLLNDKNENDIEMANNTLNELSRDRILFDLDYMDQQNDQFVLNKRMNKICDLSCNEHMRYVHSTFKNCFSPTLHPNPNNNESKMSNGEKFEAIWKSLKFLSKNPKSCDYYGSTLFHYAASDNQCDLLKRLVEKDPSGVFCIDSKGLFFL